MVLPGAVVVRQGTFLYAGQVVCDIRVRQSPIWYGTGDYEDPPELADDRECECSYLQYSSSTERGVYKNSIGPFITVDDALRHASEILGVAAHLEWE